jgi:hypothetical protein
MWIIATITDKTKGEKKKCVTDFPTQFEVV